MTEPKYLAGARRNLEREALKYARMKALGYYIENDNRIMPSGSDRKDYVDIFAQNLLRAADDLLAELASVELPEASP